MGEIKKAGYQLVTPVLITNAGEYTSVESVSQGLIEQGQPLITVRK